MKKALVLWSLLLVLALLAGCGSQAADNGNDTPNNDAVTDSQDNAPADAPANQLAKAYDSDAAGLLSAMAEYPAEDVELLAWLLVYGESYGDLDAFRQEIRQQLHTASRVSIDVKSCDMVSGVISVRVTEDFVLPGHRPIQRQLKGKQRIRRKTPSLA